MTVSVTFFKWAGHLKTIWTINVQTRTLIVTSCNAECFVVLFSDFEIRMDSVSKKVLPITATDDGADSSVQRCLFWLHIFSSRLVLFICVPSSYFFDSWICRSKVDICAHWNIQKLPRWFRATTHPVHNHILKLNIPEKEAGNIPVIWCSCNGDRFWSMTEIPSKKLLHYGFKISSIYASN